MGRCLSFLFLLLCLSSGSHGFNVDTNQFLTFNDPTNQSSMFGYSISLYQSNGINALIVGGPNASTTNIRNTGAAYRCDIETQTCETIKGSWETQTGQMLGATVVSHKSGVIVVCAPKFYVQRQYHRERYEPIGMCFKIIENFRTIRKISPCFERGWGYNNGGYCLAGTSAAVSKANTYLGLPGMIAYQGSCFKEFTNIWNQHRFCKSPSSSWHLYAGYSITYGEFHMRTETIAIGAPREEYFGVVNMFNSQNMDYLQYNYIKGEQYGAYFGYALATVDVDGDEKDDLLVSAPMYTNKNIANGYETGRVYIYLQSQVFQNPLKITGYESQSRFGTSICSLGNINNDKHNDFAIGAPFAGSGKVYIYHGSNILQDEMKPSQVLKPKDSNNIPVQGFGFSLSGGTDVDFNGYPDIAVGAYESNQVFVYKARPIVDVAFMMFSHGPISENNTECIATSLKTPCTIVQACFTYSGKAFDFKT